VASIVRLLGLATAAVLALVLGLLRLWYRAVLMTPEVKRRKAARRARRHSGMTAGPRREPPDRSGASNRPVAATARLCNEIRRVIMRFVR
jgi:hypothetical protein